MMWKLDYTSKNNKVRPWSHTLHKSNSNGSKKLNMKIKTTKSLEENKEENLYKLGLENFFCEYDLKSMSNLFLKNTLNFFKI